MISEVWISGVQSFAPGGSGGLRRGGGAPRAARREPPTPRKNPLLGGPENG